MGLIAQLRHQHYVWSWRVRYWWLDTREGAIARWTLCAFAAVIAVMELVRSSVRALQPVPADQPQQAIYWWVVELIIVLVAAVVSYATRPKPQKPAPATGDAPTTADGQAVKDVFGTVWIDDEFLLAWKIMGTTPVKSGGGKK